MVDIKRYTCGDCGKAEGENHEPGCDQEKCPFCNGQLLSCDCCYKLLGYNFDHAKEFCGLPRDVYEHGMTKKDSKRWEKLLAKKGYIPFLEFPLLCAKCGEVFPEMFMDSEWDTRLGKHSRIMLCRGCYNILKVVGIESVEFPKTICARCGETEPENAIEPTDAWWLVSMKHLSTVDESTKRVLCRCCYETILKFLNLGGHK